MKQTAVELLINYFKEQKCSHWCIQDLLARLYVAKEMEKEQIIDAFIGYDSDTQENIEVAEQYYNQTFKSE